MSKFFWTKETALAEQGKYSTHVEMVSTGSGGSAYNFLNMNNLNHLIKFKRKKRAPIMSDEDLVATTVGFTSAGDFKKANVHLYDRLKARKHLDKYLPFKIARRELPNQTHTKESVMAFALTCKGITDFNKRNGGWAHANKNGYIDELVFKPKK